MSMFSDMGINVIEAEEAEDGPDEVDGGELVAAKSSAVAKTTTGKEPADRTDDPGAHVPARNGLR